MNDRASLREARGYKRAAVTIVDTCDECARANVGPCPHVSGDGRNEIAAGAISASDNRASQVAALYVETDGAYYGLANVDPWDETRDARLYAGPYPVVAHPPCNKWSPLAYINQRRIPDYKLGDDGGCFKAALASVEKWGGVLEHPANSVAWSTFGLPKPQRGYWLQSFTAKGWVTEVSQAAYGHRARKRTWLYYVGETAPPKLDWNDPKTSAIVSGFTHQPKGAHVPCEHRRVRPREASRTPIAFRDLLLELARTSRATSEVAA